MSQFFFFIDFSNIVKSKEDFEKNLSNVSTTLSLAPIIHDVKVNLAKLLLEFVVRKI